MRSIGRGLGGSGFSQAPRISHTSDLDAGLQEKEKHSPNNLSESLLRESCRSTGGGSGLMAIAFFLCRFHDE
ncbi:hypothetical protein BH10PLA2_BH10PLA2_30560 [soil metagenome]